jgi:PAS domain S-box-containing protein
VTLRLRLLVEWAIVAILASAIIIFALQWRGTAAFDNLFYDQLSSIGRPEADKEILLVAIDDPSMAALGQWPWPRSNHAKLVQQLQQGEPRSILLDILLSDQGPAAEDEQLAAAVKAAAMVHIPVHFSTPGSDGRAYDTILPIAPLAQSAKGLGHVNVEFDSDGRVRRVALCFQPAPNAERWPHIVEVITRRDGKPSPAYLRTKDCSRTLLIPYARRGSYSEISYLDAMEGGIPPQLLKGRDVIVGATATGSGDSYPAPFGDGGLLSGAEIMANVMAAIKRDNFINPVDQWIVILLSVAPTLLLLFGFLRLRPRNALIVSVGAMVAILAASGFALAARLWFPPGAALLGIFLVYPMWGWRRLQAMSDFMGSELGELEREGELIPLLPNRQGPADIVGRQSEQLAGAIDQIRDLRRLVTDTIEHMPDPLMVTDLDGTITLTNDVMAERLGRDVRGVKLEKVLDRTVHPNYRRQVDQYLEAAMDVAVQDSEAMDSRFVRFNATRDLSFVMRTSDIRTDSGELRGHIHYFTDITDLTRAEEDREVALQLLSHDMRAPQSAIIAMLPQIGNKTTGERIERHARRTMQLAQDFVDIARMGETEFEGGDILYADLVRDVVDGFWPLAKERGITIDVVDNTTEAFIFGEPESLSRALSNLIDNAVKYSPNGSLVTVTISKAGNEIVTTVDDQGDGIDPQIARKLFERFASKRDGNARVKGLGLGLVFVRAVAERHKGSVSAENRPEGGARFIFTLPEAPEPEGADGSVQ